MIETVNEMELMKTGDQRCTDFLLEAMTFHLMTSEQKAKHCRNVSYPQCPNRPTQSHFRIFVRDREYRQDYQKLWQSLVVRRQKQ